MLVNPYTAMFNNKSLTSISTSGGSFSPTNSAVTLNKTEFGYHFICHVIYKIFETCSLFDKEHHVT